MNDSQLLKKSFAFSLRIVKMYKHLTNEKKEFVLSKQCLRSGTAIGALIKEAQFAQSNADFIHKLSIAVKEAGETDYWLELLEQSGYLNSSASDSIKTDCQELIKMLVSSIKTLKAKELKK
jgi:four helix bundle protein